MRPSGLSCACRPGEVLPLDHYTRSEAHGGCAKPPMPIPRIAGILASILGDETHRDGRITATRVLTCPRQTVIEDNVPTAIDVMSYNSIYDGIVEHAAMQRHAPPGTYTEVRLPLPGQPKPRLFGVEMEGTPDFVTADLSEIHDYKKHSETAQKFHYQRGGAEPELAAQLNIYRLMLEQCVPGANVRKLVVWHGAMTSAGGPPPWFRVELPLMDEAAIARLKPHGGEFTIQQIVDAYVTFAGTGAATVAGLPTDSEVGLHGARPSIPSALRSAIRSMPLAGRGMWRGKKCSAYCGVKALCDELEGVARF